MDAIVIEIELLTATDIRSEMARLMNVPERSVSFYFTSSEFAINGSLVITVGVLHVDHRPFSLREFSMPMREFSDRVLKPAASIIKSMKERTA